MSAESEISCQPSAEIIQDNDFGFRRFSIEMMHQIATNKTSTTRDENPIAQVGNPMLILLL